MRLGTVLYAVFKKCAITANGHVSADVGYKIMQLGGSVADAAIATMLCDGVLCPERMGIGGGFMMTIYKQDTKKVEVLLAREIAPYLAHKKMFDDNAASSYGNLCLFN